MIYSNSQEIGGYFGLELNKGKEYYPDLIKLNTGRNCLEYILRIRKYSKIYIPYFTCEVILEPLRKLNIEFEFYSIDENLDILFNQDLREEEAILVNNYFGIKDKEIVMYSKKYKNIIVDNSQAFYHKPLNRIDTFYSPRKFFGVPDGAYLSSCKELDEDFERDVSYNRMSHLLKRLDVSASHGYSEFKKNDAILIEQPIKKISNLTRKILSSIEYENVKMIRERNFKYLHSVLKEYNGINIDISDLNGPMVYPYLSSNSGRLKKILIQNRIYVATYWPNVLNWCDTDSIENKITTRLLPLPVDQRYGKSDMDIIIKILEV